jgi:hypothetical protein
MKKLKIVMASIFLFLGVFLFIYGGYDDSPGAQGLGLLIVFGSIWILIKKIIKKK